METTTARQPDTTAERLALYQRQISSPVEQQQQQQQQRRSIASPKPSTETNAMARDPITCHVLNTLTGTPAANLPCTLTLLSDSQPISFTATTDSDGRIKTWEAGPNSNSSTTVANTLQSLPTADSKTNWAIRFEVGPWFEAQGIESFWPEVQVKFTVRGRGVEGQDGWRHYHVPVLLGPWSYSTYRGS